MLTHDPCPCGEEAPDQGQDALVGHPAAHLFQHESVLERSETVLDVSFDHPLIRAWRVDEEPHLFDGVLRPGRNPYEVGQKSASKIGSSTSLVAVCTIL